MKDLILKIYDDEENVIFQQTIFDIEDDKIDQHGRKLVVFFMAKTYETFDYHLTKNK